MEREELRKGFIRLWRIGPSEKERRGGVVKKLIKMSSDKSVKEGWSRSKRMSDELWTKDEVEDSGIMTSSMDQGRGED